MTSTIGRALVLAVFFGFAGDGRAEWWDLRAQIEKAAQERLGVPVTIEKVSAGWAQAVVVSGVKVSDTRGRVRLAVREAELMSLTPLTLALRDAEVPNPGSPDGVALKVPAATVAVHPSPADLKRFDVAVSAPSGQLTGPRPVVFKDATATIACDAAGPASVRFASATLHGKVAGTLARAEGKKAPQIDVTLTGVSLSALVGKPGSERLDAHFKGALPVSLRELTGHGRATLHGLWVDLTNDPQLVALDRQASQGQTASRILGAVIRDERVGAMAGMAQNQADYYRALAQSLRRRHALGSAGGPLTISRGTATISPFAGSQLAGRIKVDLVTKALSGHLSRVSVGRATMGDVRLAGTISAPRHTVNRNKVTLDGRGAPRGPSPGRQPRGDTIVRQRPERIIRDVLGSGLFR